MPLTTTSPRETISFWSRGGITGRGKPLPWRDWRNWRDWRVEVEVRDRPTLGFSHQSWLGWVCPLHSRRERRCGDTPATRSNPWKNCKKFQFWVRESLCGRRALQWHWVSCSNNRSSGTASCVLAEENIQRETDTDICEHNTQLPHGKNRTLATWLVTNSSPNLTFRGKC